jgi:heme/copper-type cytochrome/quinol oxidase subunit 2
MIMHIILSNIIYFDAPSPWGLYFQDSATPQMEGLVELHDNIMYYLVIILFAVGWILLSIIRNYVNTKSPISHKYLVHGTMIELIWTITPAIILILIAFPSFKLLYLMDEVSDPSMSVLAEGLLSGGLKLFILYVFYKIKDASFVVASLASSHLIGEKNNTYVSSNWLAQVKDTGYSLYSKSHKHISLNANFVPHKRAFHTKVRASNRIGPHNQDILSVVIGSLLGDGYANARTIEGTRISYRQSEVHKDYLFWLYDFYSQRGYCSNLKPRKYTRKLNGKEFYGYEFNTFTFRSFNWIHKLFYKKGLKYINPNLELYLTPLALAVLIMDDGCWTGYGVRIATNCFKLDGVKLLANMLVKLYGLNYTIQNINGHYSIYITKDSIPKLRNIVLPYVIPSMKYKLGIKNNQ